MINVKLGFKAFDIHELLTHFVAQRGGFYQQQALQVGLIDTTFIPDDKLPPRTFHAACAAALFGYVNGAPYKVVLVNTDRPMFWLYSANGVSRVAELAGKRIASYPAMAPPAQFLAALTAGIDVQLLPVASDVARLALLKSGDADAALISSALPPAVMAEQGFGKSLLLGDAFRAPTTGLAVNCALLAEVPELVSMMVNAYQQSLSAIHNDDALLKQVLTEDLALPVSAVEETVMLVRELFTVDGRSSEKIEQAAISAVATHLGVENIPAEKLYDYSLLRL
ncbi:MAG: hypothetical protein E2O80_05005 [Betaproteobacteria bacterium]|nr:MAG: hypothetical protein E2O80_05005 [Betaproteobacteria bacterium]